MTAQQLVADLQTRGVRLTVDGDRLFVDAPAGVVTHNLKASLKQHKNELVRLLGGTCGTRNATLSDPGEPLNFGDICTGWSPASWAEELRRKANRCVDYRPDIADYYRKWACDIELRLKTGCDTD